MKEYDYMKFIQKTVAAFRKGHGSKYSTPRGSGH